MNEPCVLAVSKLQNAGKTSQEARHVAFKISICRYDDTALDRLRFLSARLCRRCEILCAIERVDGRRTTRLLFFNDGCVSRARQTQGRRALLQTDPL